MARKRTKRNNISLTQRIQCAMDYNTYLLSLKKRRPYKSK